MKISYYLTIILLVIVFAAFNYGCKNDANDIKNINIYFYYQNKADIADILDFANNFVEPTECKENIYNRYDIGMQYLKSFHSDTIIPKPKFAKTVDALNINRHINFSRKALREFKYLNIQNNDTIVSNNYDSIYSAMARTYDNLLLFNSRNNVDTNGESINVFNNSDSLVNYIKRLSCGSSEDVNIIWNPKYSKGEGNTAPDPKPGSSIVILPPDIGNQNIRYNELIARSKNETLNWKEWYELAALSAELNKATSLTWDYLNTAAKRAISENEAGLILDDLFLDITQRRFGSTITQSRRWKGLIEGLKRDDVSIVSLELGSTFKTGINGCYSITLLAPDLIESPANINPKFRVSTKSLSHNGAITLDLSLFLANENQWEEQFNVNLASGGTVSLNYNKAKTKVTIENNTVSGSTFVSMCVRFSQDKGTDVGTGEGTDKEASDEENKMQDRDGDGFIGYLDINDAAKTAYPKLDNTDLKLYDKIEFKVTNGDNLDGVKYDWFINGVKISAKYFVVDQVGCYDLLVRMTHENSGLSKELSSTVHCKLPIDVLKKDLEAILRVGQYKPPSQPPTIEKNRAAEAEARIYS